MIKDYEKKQVMRPRTRKTCEVPLAFILLKENEKEQRERMEQRGALSTLPTWTGILWKLHVSDLNSPAERRRCSLGGQTIIPSPSQHPPSEGLSSVIPQPKNQPKHCRAPRSNLRQFDASLHYKRAFGG